MDLTEKILEMDDVDQLVEQLSNIFKKAIIIENSNFELIAYSSPSEFSFDPVQQKSILTKRCPLFIIERLKREGFIEQLKKNDTPIRIQTLEDIGVFQRIAISLKYNGKLYGYLWIYVANEIFSEKELAFLTKIAPHIGKVLFESQQEDTKHDQQSVIWKILNHDYLNKAEIYREASIASYKLPKEFIVFVASVKDPNYLSILQKIKEVFIDMNIDYYLGKGTEIVAIVSGSKSESTRDKTTRMIKTLLVTLTKKEQNTVLVGVGNQYREIYQIRRSYLQALEVIETMSFLTVDQQVTNYFQNLGMYRYIKLMYKKDISEQYRNKSIIQLMKKDAENNSELLKTLWYFLLNDCKVGLTAEQLFIHPNTLNYRVKQIVDITGIDFSNVHVKTELYTQLLMLHYVPEYLDFYKKALF